MYNQFKLESKLEVGENLFCYRLFLISYWPKDDLLGLTRQELSCDRNDILTICQKCQLNMTIDINCWWDNCHDFERRYKI